MRNPAPGRAAVRCVRARLRATQSGLSNAPRATFSQLACLDTTATALNGADAADLDDVPDFNADRERDDDDAAFLDRRRDPARPGPVRRRVRRRCRRRARVPRRPRLTSIASDVSCGAASGRCCLSASAAASSTSRTPTMPPASATSSTTCSGEYDDADVQTIAVIAGPAIVGAQNGHGAMETGSRTPYRSTSSATRACEVVLVGHSHGAVTVDVIAARLEGEYADRFIAVVDLDRVEALYTGDTQRGRSQAPVFNVFETNDRVLSGAPYDGAECRELGRQRRRRASRRRGRRRAEAREPHDHRQLEARQGADRRGSDGALRAVALVRARCGRLLHS